jgi:toxin ParE1/3/4
VDIDIREALLTKFPFCLYYVIESDRIEIISVFHTSRDPQVWQGRR